VNVAGTVAPEKFRQIANDLIAGKFNESLTYYDKALAIDPENNKALGYFDRVLVINSLYTFATAVHIFIAVVPSS